MASVASAQVALPRRRIRVDVAAILLSIPAFVTVVLLFVYPFIYGINVSLHTGYGATGDWTLTNFTNFLGDAYQRSTIWTTFLVAIPVTIISVAVSIPLAYYMRRGIRFERLITTILILPITLGTVMVAQGMINYFGPTGWFNRTLMALHLAQSPVLLLHHNLAVEIALFVQGFPFVFLLVLGYMSAINPDLEKASRMAGANEWQTFWRIVFPLTLPGIAIAFALNFVANFGVFPTANLVGEPTHETHVLAVAAYNAAYNDFKPQTGTAIALIMGVLQLLVIGVVLFLQSRLARGASISGGKGA